MRCVVGIGNPGKEYENTFHNVGFRFLDFLRRDLSPDRSVRKFKAEAYKGTHDGSDYLLIYPQTYVNLSGESVSSVCRFYKLDPTDFLVVCDDLNLPLGKVRYREKGSDGGHNGLRSLISHFSGDGFHRLRIGIGRPERKEMVTGYVLSKIPKKSEESLDEACLSLLQPVKDFIMTGKVQIPEQKTLK